MEYSAQFYTILAYFDWFFMVFDTAIVLDSGNMTLYGLVWCCMTPVTGNSIKRDHLMNYFPLLSIPFTVQSALYSTVWVEGAGDRLLSQNVEDTYAYIRGNNAITSAYRHSVKCGSDWLRGRSKSVV